MNAAVGVPTGSRSGSGTLGSKSETASYARAPTAPPVKRGMPSVGWTRRRGTNAADRVERVRRLRRVDRQIRRVLADRDGSRQRPRNAVADLEQPPRADAEEAVPPEPLAALDRFEEVGRGRSVVEPQERPDRGLEVGRPRGAQQERVGVGREALRLRQAERIGCRHVVASARPVRAGNQERPFVQGRKVVPSAVPPSFGDAALRDRRAERIRRSALPCIAGALRRSLLRDGDPSRFGPEAPGSIHRRRRSGFHQPPDLSADARRVLVPFIARSSRCPRSLGFALRGVKVAGGPRRIASCRRAPAASDSGESGDPSLDSSQRRNREPRPDVIGRA